MTRPARPPFDRPVKSAPDASNVPSHRTQPLQPGLARRRLDAVGMSGPDSGGARPRDRGATPLDGGGLGAVVTRDLTRELRLGLEHALDRSGARRTAAPCLPHRTRHPRPSLRRVEGRDAAEPEGVSSLRQRRPVARVPNARGLHGERRDRLLTTRGVRVGRTDDDPATPIAAVGLDECGGEGTVRPQA